MTVQADFEVSGSAVQHSPDIEMAMRSSARVVLSTLATSRSCVVTFNRPELAGLLAGSVSEMRLGTQGREAHDDGSLPLPGESTIYGPAIQDKAIVSDLVSSMREFEFQNTDSCSQLFIIDASSDRRQQVNSGLDTIDRRRQSGGTPEITNYLDGVIRYGRRAMVMVLAPNRWGDAQISAFEDEDPDSVIGKVKMEVAINHEGRVNSFYENPNAALRPLRRATAPRPTGSHFRYEGKQLPTLGPEFFTAI